VYVITSCKRCGHRGISPESTVDDDDDDDDDETVNGKVLCNSWQRMHVG